MDDPVIIAGAPSGQSYERPCIEEHLARTPTDPLTNEPLSGNELNLIPNRNLRDGVLAWKAANANWRALVEAARRDREDHRQQLLFARLRPTYALNKQHRQLVGAEPIFMSLLRRSFGPDSGLAASFETVSLGLVARLRDDGPKMLLHFEAALSAQLNDTARSFLMTNIGIAHHIIGKNADFEQRERAAVECFEAATDLDPFNTEAWRSKAWSLDRLAQTASDGNRRLLAEQALENVERALQLDPNDAVAYDIKGRVLRALERKGEAREAFEMSVALSPSNARAWCALAELQKHAGSFDDALLCFRRAIDADPQDAVTRQKYGKCLQDFAGSERQNRRHMVDLLERAIVAYKESQRLDLHSGLVYANHGYCLWLLGRCGEARSMWRQGLAKAPGDTSFVAKNLGKYMCNCHP